MNSIHLIGAEEVRSAGHQMKQAADEMSRAASSIESSLERQRQFMDDWLLRLSELLEKGVK